MESIWSDLRYSIRTLLRTPLFTIASIATLAIGVGATTAMVAVVNSLLLKALPYPDAERLVVLTRENAGPLTGQIFLTLRGRLRSLEGLAAQSSGGFGWNLTTQAGAEYVEGLRVSREYFGVLGVYPAIGREFTDEEDRPGGPRVAIISSALWRRHFGGRRDVIGQSVLLGGTSRTIVGVMPSGFQTLPSADVWTPSRMSDRDNTWSYLLVGRLKKDVTLAQARSDFQVIWPNVSNIVARLPGAGIEQLRTVTLSSYRSAVTGERRGPLLILLAAVCFLLLVTCVNIAGLQLLRATARMREMAVRAALGGRRHLPQLLLVESMVQSLSGGLLGLLLGWVAVRTLPTLVPERLLGSSVRVDIDWGVLTVALALSTVTGVLFGLVPILDVRRVEHTSLHQALGAMGTRQSPSGRTIRRLRANAVAEIGLTAVLLVGAGLLIRTYDNLQRVDLGFSPQKVVTASMSFRGVKPRSAGTAAMLERTLARLRELSMIEGVAVASSIPIERGLNLPLEPPHADTSRGVVVDWTYVSGPYFDVFGIPVRAGRLFDHRDGTSSSPVAIVNEAFVRTYFGGRLPIGQQIRLARGFQGDPPREIVGVVADVKSASGATEGEGINAVARPAPPMLYVPAAQVPERLLEMAHGFVHANWAVRVRSTDRRTIDAIETVIRDTHPAAPIVQTRTMEEVIGSEIEMERFHAAVIGILAAVAMVLAIVGMYGVMAYSITQRTQEVGIRMAVGARWVEILYQFVREALTVTVIALVLGLAASAVLAQTLQSLIWRVHPLDPATFAVAASILIITSTAASLIPAVRGARTDPSRVLRLD
jgi:putative ABC transport system permease protein